MHARGFAIRILFLLFTVGTVHAESAEVAQEKPLTDTKDEAVATAVGETTTSAVVAPVSEVSKSSGDVSEPSTDSESGRLPDGLAKELSQLKPQKESANSEAQSGVLDMAMGLVAVLGVIVALAWLAKRFNVNGVSLSHSLKLQSVLSLGSKEKVVVVNVEGRRFLLGVTPHQINILSELETNGEPNDDDLISGNPSFAQQIKKALTQGKLGEDSKTS